MIQANDLRVGNWIKIKTNSRCDIEQIEEIWIPREEAAKYRVGTNKSFGFELENVQPILITMEVLEKCGFEKTLWKNSWIQLKVSIDNWKIEYNIHANESISFKIMADGGYDEGGEFDLLEKCKYLHQIQNLFTALTGKELIYTP